MGEDYEILTREQFSKDAEKEEILSFWVENGVHSRARGRVRFPHVALILKHLPSGRVVGTTTASLLKSLTLNGYYYTFALVVAPGHTARPRLLEETIGYLESKKDPRAKGVTVKRKNKKITNKILKRYNFIPTGERFFSWEIFYRDFK